MINKKQFVVACEPFKFPSTMTNKSYVVKKLYFAALYHYEQVYFKGQSGKPVHNVNTNIQPMSPASHLQYHHSGSSSEKSLKRARMEGGCESPRPTPMGKLHRPSHLSQGPPDHLNQGDRFNGVVDYRGANGYVVTIIIQGHRFQAALINRSAADGNEGAAAFFPSSSMPMLHPLQEMDSGFRLGGGAGGGGGGQSSAQRRPRPAPVPPKSAFTHFFESVGRERLLESVVSPDGSLVNPSELSEEALYGVAQELWNHMDPLGKSQFEIVAEQDQQRYEEELSNSQSFLAETPSSFHSVPRGHLSHPVMSLPVPLPYGSFMEPSFMPSPFGLQTQRQNMDCNDKAGPGDKSRHSSAQVQAQAPLRRGNDVSNDDDDDSRILEAVLGGDMAHEDEMDLAMVLGADLSEHLDIFGGVAHVAAINGGGVSKASSLLMGEDKSPIMTDGISSACTTATREKALV